MMTFDGKRLTREICTAIAILCISPFSTIDSAGATDDRVAMCGEHGTTIEFADSPAEAAKLALRQEKLVFVLHVSGNFETPEYT